MKNKIKEIFKLICEDIINYKWILIAVPVYLIVMSLIFGSFCPIYGIFHIPCPGCGMTRALMFFITGHFEESFKMHPLAGGVIAFAIYLFIFRYIIHKKPRGVYVILTILCILMFIVYFFRMLTYGPHFL